MAERLDWLRNSAASGSPKTQAVFFFDDFLLDVKRKSWKHATVERFQMPGMNKNNEYANEMRNSKFRSAVRGTRLSVFYDRTDTFLRTCRLYIEFLFKLCAVKKIIPVILVSHFFQFLHNGHENPQHPHHPNG